MKQHFAIMLALACLFTGACTATKWADERNWYQSTQEVNDSLVDVFYFVSTEVLEEKDEAGRDLFLSLNTEEERKSLLAEMEYARDMFGDSVNFFSPFYSQFTVSSMKQPTETWKAIRAEASKDAAEAFRYYIKHKNHRRPFILVGFSQGSMHLVDVLKKMNKDIYQRMIAAYCLGYRLSKEELEYPHIKPAQDKDANGVIVSFNSVSDTCAIWPLVSKGAAVCTNPINYRTDSEPATLIFQDDTMTVSVEPTHNVLLVKGENMDAYSFPPLADFCKPGNLHHWDLLFYRNAIRQNALRRAYQKKPNHK